MLCTHASFRFAFEKLGAEAFDNCLLAIDEFHHASGDADSSCLGKTVMELMDRDKAHITAMTGSYFRGDSVPVLLPEYEERFAQVVYTYYEQLNGYQYLKELELGYYFYQGRYLDSIIDVLDPREKTIIHIPNVNSRESAGDKIKEVEQIIDAICAKTGGKWAGVDKETGFQLIKCANGKTLRIADLVDDESKKRERVIAALKDPAAAEKRGHVDIIIALGMAKEGFDWLWCEHALTVGYRASLTEIVQIIGRCTRDAMGKLKARFTNLIAEPDAGADNVAEAVNDTLKAIAASLLMEQVLTPKFEFAPKRADDNTAPEATVNKETGAIRVEIKGLAEPKSAEAQRICQEDLTDIIAPFLQDKNIAAQGLFNPETLPEDVNISGMGKVIAKKYPEMPEEDREAIRQRAVAQLTLLQQARKAEAQAEAAGAAGGIKQESANKALLEGVRKFMNVRSLNVDLIDSINPFGEAYAILSKSMNAQLLQEMRDNIARQKPKIDPDEAKILADCAVRFKRERGRLPQLNAADQWESRMAAGASAFVRYKQEGRYEQ